MSLTNETWAAAAKFRRDAAAITDGQVRAMVISYANAWDEVAADLEDAVTELVAGAKDGNVTRAMVSRSRRLRTALELIGDRLDKLAAESGAMVIGDLRTAVATATAAQDAILTTQLPTDMAARVLVNFEQAPTGALDVMMRRVSERITAATLPLSAEATDVMKRELVRGLVGGVNPNETAARTMRRVQGVFEGGAARAARIARTETLDAMREAARIHDTANTDTLRGWQWVASLSSRTCPACWGMHGTEHAVIEPGPLGHPNCLVAGAVVSGPRALASTTRWFDGEVVEVITDGGRRLTVTPNHPILTTAGWVAAGALSEGHYLVCGEGVDRPAGVDSPDDHQVPALIEDVAEAVGGSTSGGPVLVPTAAEDFHGDGAGSEVHVVRTDRLLWNDGQASLLHPSSHLPLLGRGMGGNPRFAGFASGRGLHERLRGPLAPAHRDMGRGDAAPILLRASTGHHESVRVGGASNRHTCGLQAVLDRPSRHTEGLGQGVDGLALAVAFDEIVRGQAALRQQGRRYPLAAQGVGLGASAPVATVDESRAESIGRYSVPSRDSLTPFAGQIVTDRVVELRRRGFRGHVYNLQTATGWYVANGILTHNCRCARVPVLKSWRDLGIDIDEPADLLPDAGDAFGALPKERQVEVLGPQRWAAWDRGDYPMGSWASRRENSGWRDSYVTSPAA